MSAPAEFNSPLDPGIEKAVRILREAGIETYESCEGGPGHAYPEPAVRFHGDNTEGYRAVAHALQRGLPVAELHRLWRIENGELVGPTWQLTFSGSIS